MTKVAFIENTYAEISLQKKKNRSTVRVALGKTIN